MDSELGLLQGATVKHSIEFFDRQFQRADPRDFALNPFEQIALEFAQGDVLDAGCGLGNLSFELARRGQRVQALDGSPTAIASLRTRARAAMLPIEAEVFEAATFEPTRRFDCVVCIGLLMFLDCDTAEALLHRLQDAVRPGGTFVVNVLVRGTTYLEMFDPAAWCIFDPVRLSELFSGWNILRREDAHFAAPGDTVKQFRTLVAQRAAV